MSDTSCFLLWKSHNKEVSSISVITIVPAGIPPPPTHQFPVRLCRLIRPRTKWDQGSAGFFLFFCFFTSSRSWSLLQYSLPLELGRSVEGLDGGGLGRKTVISASQAFRTRAGPLAKLDLGLQGRDLCLNDSFVSVLFSLPVNP